MDRITGYFVFFILYFVLINPVILSLPLESERSRCYGSGSFSPETFYLEKRFS
jgi:hypothetical protein